MYSRFPTFVLAFHGCDQEVRDKILSNKDRLVSGQNDYDWLGNGIYFWENNHHRALEYAQIIKDNPERCKTIIKNPSVIGAVIDLGNCLNLLDSRYIEIVKNGHTLLTETAQKAGFPLPENRPIKGGKELLLRKLDCAVIETIHQSNKEKDRLPFDTVRAVFEEGDELYPNAGFRTMSHIQICVRNPNCIKGYFHPLDPIDGYNLP